MRRQEATQNMRIQLHKAQGLEANGQLTDAAKVYQEAYEIIPRVQIGKADVEVDKKAVLAGLSGVRLKLARQAAAKGDYLEANQQLDLALKRDPNNPQLLQARVEFDKAQALLKGKTPDAATVALAPALEKDKIDNSTTIQNAKFLYEAGKYDEAEAKLNEVTKREPGNSAAYYYLDLVKEARYKDLSKAREAEAKTRIGDVTKSWIPERKNENLPVPNNMATTNLIYTSKERQQIKLKLELIRLNEVKYEQLPLSEVLSLLRDESKKRDPDKIGINFILNTHQDPYVESTIDPTALLSMTMGGGTGGGMGALGAGRGARGGAVGGPLGPDGAPLGATAPQSIDMKSVTVSISPAVSNIRLSDLLDLICKVSSDPVKYTIEDYGVMFSPKTQETQGVQLFARTFHVDPNTFVQGLQSVTSTELADVSSGNSSSGGSSGGNSGGNNSGNGSSSSIEIPMVSVAGGGNSGGNNSSGGGRGGNSGGRGGNSGGGQGGGQGGGLGGGMGGYQDGLQYVTSVGSTMNNNQLVRLYFTAAGVDLLAPGKMVFFNDRTGIILVRATLQDLEIIDAAIQTLNVAPPQLQIEGKFAEISQDDSRAMGFDWMFGNMTLGGGKVGMQPGTAPSYTGKATTANPSGVFPNGGATTDANGVTSYGNAIAPSASDGVLTSGIRNQYGANSGTIPALGTITGILTDPQFRVVIRAIEQRSGTDLLSAPKLTTLSGRQAHIAVQDQRTLVTGLNSGQTASSSTSTTIGSSGGGSVAASLNYNTQSVPLGPSLDVMPSVSSDGYSIQMVLIPTITEFVGYDDPGQFVTQAQSVSSGQIGSTLTATLPLPRMRVRQVVTSCIVWDGQTVVLGGLLSENITKIKDKVPFLGDMPLVGRLFRSESSSTEKKNLMIFVTPRIIDPAGNPLHRDEDMPFAHDTLPAATATTAAQ